MLHREFIAVCAEIHKQQESQQTNKQTYKHIVSGQNVEICELNLLVYEAANRNKRLWYFSPVLTRRALKKKEEET